MFEHVVNTYPKFNTPLSAKYAKGFAYPTFKERVPGILQGVIDDLKNEKDIQSKFGENTVKEIDTVIQKVEAFKNGMTSDQPLVEIIHANRAFSEESAIYNNEINQRKLENGGNYPTWFQTEWLFAECYQYFKLNEIISSSSYLNKYDPFLKVKTNSLLASKQPILQLSKYMIENRVNWLNTEEEKRGAFIFLFKCSLWGNKADLSLSGGKAVAAIEDVYSQLNVLDQNIIINNLEEVYELLNTNEDQIIDIVLDNAGYELFNDLCLADFLIHAGFAKKIIFHGKPIPWFVSDVTPLDFTSIFEMLPNQMKSEYVISLTEEWLNYQRNGHWIFKAESFWITPYDFSKMANVDLKLYEQLAKNKLAIFKGDLNYRKLVGDIYWEPTTDFKTVLRGFEPTNILALRTLKSDTVAALKKGLFEELSQKDPNWLVSGNYAIVQLFKKN